MLLPLPSQRLRRLAGGRVALFLVLFGWPVLLVSPSGTSMTDSVLLAAIRLVNEGTMTLSDGSDPERVFLTRAFDISFHDGRVYSGVGPGGSVIAAPFYLAAKPVFSFFGEEVVKNRRILGYYRPGSRALGEAPAPHFKDMYLLQIALVWVLVAPLYGLLLARIDRRLVEGGAPRSLSTVVVLAVGIGSMALYYCAMYSGQALAYLLVWHAVLSLSGGSTVGRRASLLAGGAFGAAIAVDYPSALAIGLSLAFVLPRLAPVRRLQLLLPLGLSVGLLLVYHESAFGSPWSTPYQNRFWIETEAAAERGLVAFEEGRRPTANLPSPEVMLQLAFGFYKGLFLYSPILLLGLLGHLKALGGAAGRRTPHLLSLCLFVAYLIFNSTLGTHVPRYGHHFWGGLSMLWGPRHLFAVLPFLAWGLVGLDWARAWVRWASGLALLLSCSINVAGAMFSDVIMSTYAFGQELRYPILYAFRLLLEQGPRSPLLGAYGVDPRAQTVFVLGLLLATLVVVVVRVKPDARRKADGR
jgi:hypothetical protein